jgi:peptidoglycan/xylan/chitin deacetylase (PgdA/CDA1 family)
MKPLVNFQGHTLFHPCLPNCSDENAWEEIVQSKQVLEQDFGLPINAMAYPNGDYSDREIAFIKEAGYACAVSVDFGFNTIHTNPYRLKRLSIDDSDNVDAVSVKSCGLWTFLLGLLGKRKWNRRVRPLSQQVAHAKTFFFLTYRLSTEVLNYEYTPIYIF